LFDSFTVKHNDEVVLYNEELLKFQRINSNSITKLGKTDRGAFEKEEKNYNWNKTILSFLKTKV
jgi:hypothetical protein